MADPSGDIMREYFPKGDAPDDLENAIQAALDGIRQAAFQEAEAMVRDAADDIGNRI